MTREELTPRQVDSLRCLPEFAGPETVRSLCEEVADLRARLDGATDALEHICNVLGNGGCGVIACEGCAYEMGDAAQTAHEALGRETSKHEDHVYLKTLRAKLESAESHLAALQGQLEQADRARIAEVEHWVTRYRELDNWRIDTQRISNERAAASARLTAEHKALKERLARADAAAPPEEAR